MKKFIHNLLLFTGIIFLIMVIGIFMPPTPRSKTSLLFAKLDKDSLLSSVQNPRMILIGGSNLSFGINSQMIKDSLNVNPINTGIQASLGLQYMLQTSLPFIRKGDIVIVSPEYNNFFGKAAYGSEVLCRIFFDVQLPNNRNGFFEQFKSLSLMQLVNISTYIPKYVVSKFSPFEYFGFKKDLVYSRDSFNKFGDVYKHFGLPTEAYAYLEPITDQFNQDIIQDLKKFEKNIEAKGAKMFITFSGIEKSSFNNNIRQIKMVTDTILKNNFIVLGKSEMFIFNKNETFNGFCHLNKEGMDKRTAILINQYKKSR